MRKYLIDKRCVLYRFLEDAHLNEIMKIHFLTTGLSDASGGAIYDYHFYKVLLKIYPEVKLFDDKYFLEKTDEDRNRGFLRFCRLYKMYCSEIFDCDYLIMNSRIYTRFLGMDLGKIFGGKSGKQLLVIHHHNNYMTHRLLLYRIHKHYEMKVLSAATKLIIPNPYVIDQLKKSISQERIEFLPSSFKKGEFQKTDLRNKRILFVGNIEKRKGLMLGLKAFHFFYQENRDYQWVLAGAYKENESYYTRLKRYVEKNGLTEAVLFENRVSNERLEWLYAHSDVFLFPSLHEGYGWVMVEAMAHGVPVIAFDNSAIPYTVKNGYNGLLAENKNWKEMYRALSRSVSDGRLLAKMQKGAMETHRQTFSMEELDSRTETFIASWN